MKYEAEKQWVVLPIFCVSVKKIKKNEPVEHSGFRC